MQIPSMQSHRYPLEQYSQLRQIKQIFSENHFKIEQKEKHV